MRRSSSFANLEENGSRGTSSQPTISLNFQTDSAVMEGSENRFGSGVALYSLLGHGTRQPSSSRTPLTQCWVCYGTVGEDPSAAWIHPCRCKGGLEWVHQRCLHRWIDEKLKGDANARIPCSVCGYEYVIIYPPAGPLLETLHNIDIVLSKSSSFVMGILLAGGLYWSGVTYGALTLMQVLGHREGMAAIERVDPLFLIIGLPFIPIGLVLSRYINWQQSILRLWRQYNRYLPIIQYFVPKDIPEWRRHFALESSSSSAPMDVIGSIPRNIVGGLALPTISTIMGKLLYSRVRSNLQRTILGLLTYIVLKGFLSLYYAEATYVRNCRRQIKEYTGSDESQEE